MLMVGQSKLMPGQLPGSGYASEYMPFLINSMFGDNTDMGH